MIPVLTIDGPSGVGKGTVANIMAHELKWNLFGLWSNIPGFCFGGF